MSSNICKYCGKIYSAKSNLNLHQKTAKFCLKIQSEMTDKKLENEILKNGTNSLNKINETISPKKDHEYRCEFCNDSFNLKLTFQRHIDVCRNKFSFFIQKKEEEFDIIRKENQSIATELAVVKNDLKNSDIMLIEKDKTIKSIITEKENTIKSIITAKDKAIMSIISEKENTIKNL